MNEKNHEKQIKWTDEQSKVIHNSGKSILVSAAAGSGKTAVLVERIKNKIIEEKIPVTKLFVATFTEAAANEMKEKIRKTLRNELDKPNSDRAFLQEQLQNLNNAQIGTFHSFCTNVIRRHFQLIDIEPNFKVCDEIESQMLKDEVMDNLFDDLYEENSSEFIDFMDAFCGDKDEFKLRQLILGNYNHLMSLPEPFETLHEMIINIKKIDEIFLDSILYNFIIKNVEDAISNTITISNSRSQLLKNNNVESLLDKVSSEELELTSILDYVKNRPDFDVLREMILAFQFENMRAKKDEQESFNECKEFFQVLTKGEKDIFNNVRKTYFQRSLKEHIRNIKITYPRACEFEKILTKYHDMYSQVKRENNFIDFNDMEQFALKILTDDDVCREYKDKFEYVFVDEYQDTNYVQEEIIKSISRENNLFLVGDVKQSIYGFRGAIPQIFQNRYLEFQKDAEHSVKIDLNANFRSSQGVIDTVNEIFKVLMDPIYDEKAMLYKGEINKDKDHEKKDIATAITDIHIVDEEKLDADVDAALEDLKKIEREALQVARIIHNEVGRKFWDEKLKTERNVEYKDIVLLLRTIKGKADIYYNALMKDEEQPIPAFIDDNEGYFDTIEIDNYMSLLSIVDNKKQDIPLIAVLKSEIFGFTIDELINIRLENKGKKYYEAFVNYANNGKNLTLKEKCEKTLHQIDEWKALSRTIPLDDFIWELLIQTNFYLAMGALPAGAQRQANLRLLVDKAKDFVKLQAPSLNGFIKYIDIVKKSDVKIGQVKLVGENDNVVRIMSIHKSKGLEFPVVIVGELGSDVKKPRSEDIEFKTDLGLGLKVVNTKSKITERNLITKAIVAKKSEEEKEESMRVYYVAFTRAKDKLILVGTSKSCKLINDIEEGNSIDSSIQIPNPSLIDKLYMILPKPLKNVETHLKEEYIIDDKKGTEIPSTKLIEEASKSFSENNQSILENLMYEYPYVKATETKLKYSVSELNQKLSNEDVNSIKIKQPSFLSHNKFSNTEMGTIYHRLMEEIVFSEMDCSPDKQKEIVHNVLIKMQKKGIFNDEQAKAIDIDKAIKFFNTELGKRAINADKTNNLYKEMDFVLRKTQDLEGDGENEEILIQGIIDCFFEEDGEYVLIDYKTNYIDKEQDLNEEIKRIASKYAEQIQLYADAINNSKNGKVKEAYLYLQGVGTEVPMKLN